MAEAVQLVGNRFGKKPVIIDNQNRSHAHFP
jgi:hypothetical protein